MPNKPANATPQTPTIAMSLTDRIVLLSIFITVYLFNQNFGAQTTSRAIKVLLTALNPENSHSSNRWMRSMIVSGISD
jgi:hypothetical protein